MSQPGAETAVKSAITLPLFLLVCLLVPAARAGTPKTVVAERIESPLLIDGLLNEYAWKYAHAVGDFTQYEPAEGELPTEWTAVRVLYDDRTLYIGVICIDGNPRGIVRQLSRRDRSTEADKITVMIDSYFDRKTAFVFSTNVSGVKTDGILSQEGLVYDLSWDAVWEVRARIVREGWSAEFAIPFNALRFAGGEKDTAWGINFRRYISRKKETDDWVMVPHGETSQISRWGILKGIRGLKPPLRLEVQPYVSASLPFGSQGGSLDGMAGVDLKYGIGRSFTVDATINPDFGQVEVDASVLNLTVFETLYPEKRPFFVEAAQMFSFGTTVDNTSLGLFFSRRIGKQPSGSLFVTAPQGGRVEANPQLTTIYGAAKVSGRSAGGFSVAALSAATAPEYSRVIDSSGVASRITTEPRGLYSVVRLKQELDGNSWVGVEGTAASREGQNPALSAGIDWNLRFAGETHTLDGYIAGTRIVPQAGTVWTGAAGRLLIGRISAEHWYYNTSFDFATKEFEPNDLGYFARPRDAGGFSQILYWENAPAGIFRRYGFSFVPDYRWNWEGRPTLMQVEATAAGFFSVFWDAVLTYQHRFPAYDDEQRGIIGLYRKPAADRVSLQLISDERQTVSGRATIAAEVDRRNKGSFSASLAVTVRPLSWVELVPAVLFESTSGEETPVYEGGRYALATVNGRPATLFADRDLQQMNIEFRGTLTFTRSLSLQFFLQTLLARGRHGGYRALTGPAAFEPVNLPPASYDLNQTSLNANVLLRWEYLPGSTVYLVWTQARYGVTGVYARDFGESLRQTFLLPHDDLVMLKVNYWLGW